jgi:erythromycin esterase-like protein
MRERDADGTVLIGMHGGSVTAASDWERPPQQTAVQTPLPNSWEALLHRVGREELLLRMRDLPADAELAAALDEPRLQRAIGVVYKPATERFSHYFHAALRRQFDALIHIDRTRELEPLERTLASASGDEPETFPTGL